MSSNSVTSWQIGQATVTRIEELLGPGFQPHELLATWDPAVLEEHSHWMAPDFYQSSTNQFIMSVHSWLIRTPHHTILVDTCCGNAKNRPGSPHFHQLDTSWLDRLRCTGVAPEDIDYVLCTHLHADHVGWNTRLRDGRWVPTFPNAKYVFSQQELRFWDTVRHTEPPAEAWDVFADSVLPVIAAGQDHIVQMTDQLSDSLLIEPAPGHTPGQIMLRLLSGRDEGVFIGDVMHHPIQVYQPTWNSRFCVDQTQAVKSRLRVLRHCAELRCVMFPAHFGAPHAGRIRAALGAFSFECCEAA